jgi:hypothetical protein
VKKSASLFLVRRQKLGAPSTADARVAALQKIEAALAVRVSRQGCTVKVPTGPPKPDEERRHGERRQTTSTPHDDEHLQQLAHYTSWVIKTLRRA